MNFDDTVYAATMVLLCYVLLYVPLNLYLDFPVVLISGTNIASFLLAGLITGCVFARKLSNQRLVSIGKILLLVSTFIVFFILASNFIDWTAFQEIYSTTWSAGVWAREMGFMLYQTMALYEVTLLSILSVGIYVGSMLRRLIGIQ